MYATNRGRATTPQGCAPIPAALGYASNPAVYATVAAALAPTPVPSPPMFALSSRTPSPPILTPVAVPPGCYAIELVQFWRDAHGRGQSDPLHWALFLRTSSSGGGRHPPASSLARSPAAPARGNFYELAGSESTYTAQFLQGVAFEPDRLPDWRGTHVIGWVGPAQVAVFESVVRQVPVVRYCADWRSQHWVYDVVRAVGAGTYHGMFMDGVSFGMLQRHMAKLLDAWERGDI